MLSRKVYILGGSHVPFIGKGHPNFIWKNHPDFGKRENPDLENYIQKSIQDALKETKVPAERLEKAWIGNFAGELFSNQGHLGAAVVGACPALKFKPVTRVEAACASGALAFSHAVESIQAGTNICLVVGAEVQTTVSARQGGDYLARASHYKRQRILDDFTFPALFAQRTKAYFEKFREYSPADLAYVSVKAYSNAAKNPYAHMRTAKMDFETASKASDRNPAFLSNKELKNFLRNSDCSQVSDGASAIVVVSEEGLKLLGKNFSDVIEVLTVQHSTGNLFEDGDLTQLETSKVAADRAYAATNLKPSNIQVAEVHDCFSIAEIQMYEALGFAPYGKGIEFVKNGHSSINGTIPVNPGGGLIGFGHPVGATGVKQILEIYRQMKGKCGEYQISKIPYYGLTANMGGSDKTSVVSIFQNTPKESKL
jgi:acetyl-CoA acyltransferase